MRLLTTLLCWLLLALQAIAAQTDYAQHIASLIDPAKLATLHEHTHPLSGDPMDKRPDYTVFIDESFDGFMNLAKDDGYFCYAALMVPMVKLLDLQAFWEVRRDQLATEYEKATGHRLGDQQEFKSCFFNKLGAEARRAFGDRLAYFLRKNRCFVAGFYTTVQGVLRYRLRTEVAKDDDAVELPADWLSRLEETKQTLLAEKGATPGDAYLIGDLFDQTVGITATWLARKRQKFVVVYDPRQKKEDRCLFRMADRLLDVQTTVFKELEGFYLGANASLNSSDSAGLMLADLIVRDVRLLFSDLPELLCERSNTQLILPVTQEDETVVLSIRGLRLKYGNRRPMSPELLVKLRQPTPNSTAPLYFDQLADHKLSCNALYGELRVANFQEGFFEDMTD